MNDRVISIFYLLLVGGLNIDSAIPNLKDVIPADKERLWVVRLRLLIGKQSVVCAGSIIDERWVLTSAVCASVPVCEQIEIHPASYKDGDTTTMRGELCIKHPKHKPTRLFFYNIGLIKGNEYFDGYRSFAIKVLPPEGTHNCPGELAEVLGWWIDAYGAVGGYLQKTTVKITSWKKCNEVFREHYNQGESHGANDVPSVIIPQTGFCTNRTGYTGAVEDAVGCAYGHSGSPVILHDGLVGVLSGRLRSESGNILPVSVIMNIADYMPWIYSIINPALDTSSMIVGIE